MSLQTDAVALGCTVDHHETTLRLKFTEDARRLLQRLEYLPYYRLLRLVEADGQTWVEIPFAYMEDPRGRS